MMTAPFMKFTCICYKLSLYNLHTHLSMCFPLQEFLFFHQSIRISLKTSNAKPSFPFFRIDIDLAILRL
jgi:hypothetical protein